MKAVSARLNMAYTLARIETIRSIIHDGNKVVSIHLKKKHNGTVIVQYRHKNMTLSDLQKELASYKQELTILEELENFYDEIRIRE